MRTVCLLSWLLAAGVAHAQPPAPVAAEPRIVTAAVEAVPPTVTPPEVFIEPIQIVDAPAAEAAKPGWWSWRDKPLGPGWGRTDILVWWLKPAPLPPLAVGGRRATTRTTILGGSDVSTDAHTGMLFSTGWTVGDSQTVGAEVIYFFLGTRTNTMFAGSPMLESDRTIARPVIDPNTGGEVLLPVAIPGEQRGGLRAAVSARATGWEVNGVGNLLATTHLQLDSLVGWRYFALHEGLRVEQVSWRPDGDTPGWLNAADQIDAHNHFHGGQLGLRAEFRSEAAFFEVAGKVAVGANNENVRISGLTLLNGLGLYPEARPGGVLGQPSNSTRVAQAPFAWLPEGSVRVGFRTEHSRFFVAYNFLYLSDVVRPGDQVDRVIDPVQVPGYRNGVAFAGSDRPSIPFKHSDLWVQGFTIGWETKY